MKLRYIVHLEIFHGNSNTATRDFQRFASEKFVVVWKLISQPQEHGERFKSLLRQEAEVWVIPAYIYSSDW